MRIQMSPNEAQALLSAAEAGTADDAIDNLGWSPAKKSDYRRAVRNLKDALEYESWNKSKSNEGKNL